MTNLQFRKKTDSIGLCRDEKLHEKSYFSRLERISISFDTDYHLNLHITISIENSTNNVRKSPS